MATLQDFAIARWEDGILQITMNPSVAIGGWTIRFQAQHRFGGISGAIQRYISTGKNNQSGINILNSGLGIFTVQINSVDTSGLDFSNLTYVTERMDSGFRTIINEGFIALLPGGAL